MKGRRETEKEKGVLHEGVPGESARHLRREASLVRVIGEVKEKPDSPSSWTFDSSPSRTG